MRHDQDEAVTAATEADEARSTLLANLMGQVSGCFPRRETRQCCGQMVHGLHWSDWRRRHQHRARQARQRWNAYAETTP